MPRHVYGRQTFQSRCSAREIGHFSGEFDAARSVAGVVLGLADKAFCGTTSYRGFACCEVGSQCLKGKPVRSRNRWATGV